MHDYRVGKLCSNIIDIATTVSYPLEMTRNVSKNNHMRYNQVGIITIKCAYGSNGIHLV